VRILISEDEDTVGLYKAAFESRGHEVTITKDGQECLKKYAERKYDAVVLDYKMPRVNGMQVAKEILSKNPGQRIIFSSAYSEETINNAAKELKHAIQLIPKPFEPYAIVDAVEVRKDECT
jgi:CheY-like chemotaxis protein